MSFHVTTELQGTRTYHHLYQGQIGSPAGRKYLQIISAHLTKAHLLKMISDDESVAYYNVANVGIDETGAGNYLMTGDTTDATSLTPFIVNKAHLSVQLRNNHNKDAVVSLYKVRPKTVIPNGIDTAGSSVITEAEMLPRLVVEGMADKMGAGDVATQGHVMHHSAAPAAGAAQEALQGGTSYTEASFLPLYTIFDSSAFCQWYDVIDVSTVKLKPRDSWVYKTKLTTMPFLEGIENYVSDEILAYPFTEYLVAVCMGDLGHDGDTEGIAQEAGTDPTTNRLNARKMGVADVNWTETRVDFILHAELGLQIFKSDLIAPGTAAHIEAAEWNGDKLAATYTQKIADLD